MISKSNLLSIGKISIATLLFLTAYIKVAKANIDPSAPSDPRAVISPNSQSVQISWIDNTQDETNFQVRVTRLVNLGIIGGNINPPTRNVAATPGIGTRVLTNFSNLSPGNYQYSVCVQRPGILTCNPTRPIFIIPAAAKLPPAQPPANPNPPANFPPPTNVRATRVGAGTARIFWNHPGVAQSFRVDIRLPGNNNFTQAAVVNGSLRQADIVPLAINTNYPVRVCGRTGAAPQEVCSPTINVFLPQGF